MIIYYVGTVGFPFGAAAIKKQGLISKTLAEGGHEVKIISRFSVSFKKLKRKNIWIEGVSFIYTSPKTYKVKNKIYNKINKELGALNELLYIMFSNFDVLLSNNRSFFRIFIYTIIVRLKRKKIILTFVEDNDAVPQSKSKLGRLDSKLFSRFTWKIVDGAIPISDTLALKIFNSNKNLPQLKIPVLVDYQEYDSIKVSYPSEEYFVFCGSLAYYDVINFIISAYINGNFQTKLLLILNGGNKSIWEKLNLKISNIDTIQVLTNVSDFELINFYKNSKCLLIPLRDTVQDISRFPHKIGEYCASKRPIITSEIGEIKEYFLDEVNCIYIKDYTPDELCKALKKIDKDKELRDKISVNSYELGMKYFNYKQYINKFSNFLEKI